MSKIKNIAKEAGATLTLAALAVVNMRYSVSALDPLEGGDDTGGGSGAATNAQDGLDRINEGVQAETDLYGMVGQILTVVFMVIGIVAVIMIIVGGVHYATSQGDATKVKKGKDTIMYGIIGLVVVLLSFAIVNFVLSGLRG